MVNEQGIVDKIVSKNAVIRIQRSSACAKCESKGACQALSDKEVLIEVPNDLQAKEGDTVEISVPTSSLLKLSMLVYLLPIFALIAGSYVGSTLAQEFDLHSSLCSIGGGIIAMSITFYLLKIFDRASASKAEYHPKMTRILSSYLPHQSGDSI